MELNTHKKNREKVEVKRHVGIWMSRVQRAFVSEVRTWWNDTNLARMFHESVCVTHHRRAASSSCGAESKSAEVSLYTYLTPFKIHHKNDFIKAYLNSKLLNSYAQGQNLKKKKTRFLKILTKKVLHNFWQKK